MISWMNIFMHLGKMMFKLKISPTLMNVIIMPKNKKEIQKLQILNHLLKFILKIW